jgi:N-formylglutamate deformylase
MSDAASVSADIVGVEGLEFDRVVREFEEDGIDPDVFDHEAHIHLAWCYLQHHGLAETIQRYSERLRAITRALGAEGKYHETITWFFIISIAERRVGRAADDWRVFVAENPDLFEGRGGFLRRYYSATLLGSDVARGQFVLPDRAGHSDAAA